MDAKQLNERLDTIDTWLSEPGGEALYQILSGSLRGPDNGAGKSALTMNLRPICFPRCCTKGHTGMMHHDAKTAVLPLPTAADGQALSHYVGHCGQAIAYLEGCDRVAHNQTAMGWQRPEAVAAKKL